MFPVVLSLQRTVAIQAAHPLFQKIITIIQLFKIFLGWPPGIDGQFANRPKKLTAVIVLSNVGQINQSVS